MGINQKRNSGQRQTDQQDSPGDSGNGQNAQALPYGQNDLMGDQERGQVLILAEHSRSPRMLRVEADVTGPKYADFLAALKAGFGELVSAAAVASVSSL